MLAETDEVDTDPQTYAEEQSRFLREAGQPVRISVISADGWVVGTATSMIPRRASSRASTIWTARKSRKPWKRAEATTSVCPPLNTRYFYAAVCYRDAYFLRAALPMTELDTTINNLTLCALAGVGSEFWPRSSPPFFWGNGLRARSTRLTLASAYGRRQYEARVPVRYKGEIGDLAAAFNTMADHLS